MTVGDVDNPAANLTLSAVSSNTTLVPNANVVFGGSGEDRTATITPAMNRKGETTITLTVSDGDADGQRPVHADGRPRNLRHGCRRPRRRLLAEQGLRPEHRLADERADGLDSPRSCRRLPTPTGRSRASATSTATAGPTSLAQQGHGPEHRLADGRADRVRPRRSCRRSPTRTGRSAAPATSTAMAKADVFCATRPPARTSGG